MVFALFVGFPNSLRSSEPHEAIMEQGHGEANSHVNESTGPVDITQVAFEHILDSHSWHFWGQGHEAVSVPLPVILKGNNGIACFMSSEFHHDTQGIVVVEKNGERFVNFEEKIYYANEFPNEYGQFVTLTIDEKEVSVANANPLDFSITKNVTQMFISVGLLVWLFSSIANAYKTQGVTSAPKGKQSFFEPLIVFVRDDIAKGNIGSTSDKYVPYLLTVFFFILFNNLLGLLPGSANVTGNIAITLVLAVIAFFVTNLNGRSTYWGHIFAMPGVPTWLLILLTPVEIIGVFMKPISLMIRLFANITAGHMVIVIFVGLIFVFGKSGESIPGSLGAAVGSTLLGLFMMAIELLVAFIQAYVFTILTASYIGAATEEAHH